LATGPERGTSVPLGRSVAAERSAKRKPWYVKVGVYEIGNVRDAGTEKM
jgi:hypothetical protein